MKTLLLVGSSIFEAWGSAADVAPAHRVVNRAVGGTITAYWVEHLPDVMSAESPDVVLFYCGSNDINAGVSETHITSNIATCRGIIHAFSPHTMFAYFSIIKAPQKLGNWDRIDMMNGAVECSLPGRDLFVETNGVFFRGSTDDGEPVARFFIEDGLHLTDEAYDELVAYARPRIAEWLGKWK